MGKFFMYIFCLSFWTGPLLESGIIRTSMTCTGDIGRKFSLKMISGLIITEKFISLMLFYGKIFSAICFYVQNAIILLYFTQILSKSTFQKKGYATYAFLLKKLYIIWFYVRNTNISQVFIYWIKLLIIDCNL
jgi:hypothetical protein